MATLDRHHLLPPDVSLPFVLPDDLRSILGPATVIYGDGHPLAHEVFEQQGETQADGTAAGNGDVEHPRISGSGGCDQVLDRGRIEDRLQRAGHLEAERLIADCDEIAWLEHV